MALAEDLSTSSADPFTMKMTENNNEFKTNFQDDLPEKTDPYIFTSFDEQEDMDMRDEIHDKPRSEEKHQPQHTNRRKQSKPARAKLPSEKLPEFKEAREGRDPEPEYNAEQPRNPEENLAAYEEGEKEFSYPTAYHRLGQELGFDDEVNEFTATMNPEEGVPIQRNEKGEPKTKIFHQDAYCDLCDREFCNKWFLKTHKANKHGIYENLPPYIQQAIANGQRPVYPSSPKPEMSGNSLREEMDVSPYNLAQEYNKTPLEDFPTDSPVDSRKSPPQNGSPSDSGQESKPKEGEKPQRSLEDYCELCQKHFCNKYYLRKHRMDVHGIHSDPFSLKRRLNSLDMGNLPSPSPVLLPQSTPTMHNAMSNIMLFNPFAPMMGLPHSPMIPPQMPQFGAPMAPNPLLFPGMEIGERAKMNKETKGINTDAYCEICRKEFCDKYYLKVHKANVHNIQIENTNRRSPHNSVSAPSTDRSPSQEIPKSYPNLPSYGSERNYADAPNPPTSSSLTSDTQQRERQDYDKQRDRQDYDKQRDRQDYDKQRAETEEQQSYKRDEVDGPMDFSQEAHRRTPPREESRSSPPRAESLPDVPKPKPEPPRTCEVCHKVFADKYALRMHRANIHGLGPLPSRSIPEVPKTEPPSMFGLSPFTLPPTSRVPFGMEGSNSIPSSMGMPFPPPTPTSGSESPIGTMFGSMMAAKLADRVTCDICNKEVCNKYFLKTHKVKMHGIDPNTIKDSPSPKEMKKIKAPTASVPASVIKEEKETVARELFKLHNDSANPTRNEELLKLGIDPEAYCDICKKEFCSKYFLRTHKLKMHGIPTDKPGNRKEDREISRREIMERELMAIRDFGSFYPPPMTSMAGIYPHIMEPIRSQPLPLTQLPPRSLQQSPPRFFLPTPPTSANSPTLNQSAMYTSPTISTTALNPETPANLRQEDESQDSNKSTDSKNKTAANMIRVKCDLCNKELCNKYFLRTHKLNKHGIIDECLSEGQQRKFMEKNMLSENPFSMLNQDNPLAFLKRDIEPFSQPIDFGFNSNRDSLKDDKDSRFYREYCEICHLCQRRFTSVEWLKTHLYVEHDIRDPSVPMEMTVENGEKLETRFPCQACGVLFHDKISLKVHMVQEHNVTVNVTEETDELPKPEEKPAEENDDKPLDLNVKTFRHRLYRCSQCSYKSRRFCNIQLHEARRHGIKHKPKYRCKKCNKLFRLPESLERHTQQCDGTFDYTKRFKCAFCTERFPTRLECRRHVHELHKSKCKYQCRECSYHTNDAKKLRFHVRMRHANRPALAPVNGLNHDLKSEKTPVCYAKPCDLDSQAFIMQPFTITDENDFNRFVKAVVYLPVFEKIREARSYSFQLTPAE